MGRKKLKKVKDFEPKDFVFAKLRGYRPWPARVVQKVERLYCVYFYGTRNIANVQAKHIYEYEKNKARLGRFKERSYRQFQDAMEHAESTIARPDQDEDFFKAKAELENEVDNGVLEGVPPEQPWPTQTPLLKRKKSMKMPFIHITGDSD